jgi:hypothetical protein
MIEKKHFRISLSWNFKSTVWLQNIYTINLDKLSFSISSFLLNLVFFEYDFWYRPIGGIVGLLWTDRHSHCKWSNFCFALWKNLLNCFYSYFHFSITFQNFITVYFLLYNIKFKKLNFLWVIIIFMIMCRRQIVQSSKNM